jgi:hypothetical protein
MTRMVEMECIQSRQASSLWYIQHSTSSTTTTTTRDIKHR